MGLIIGWALCFLAIFLVGWYLKSQQVRFAEEFDRRFPPISDAEFVARCTPDTTPWVALKVRRIVADQLGVNYDQIYPSTSFTEDIGAD